MSEAVRLEEEASLLGRYLVGREPSPELCERYARAHRTLLAGPTDPRDLALMRFVHRHPWSLGPLDAACGLLRPGRLLRNKILVMAAVLEATTDFAEHFLPRQSGWPGLLWIVLWQGASASLRAALGLALYPVATRT